MAILADRNTRVIIQGITGREAATMSQEMLAYGTKVVAGVTPGKGGQRVHGIPVFDTMIEAVEKCGGDASVVSVPPLFAKDAVMEAVEAGIKLIIVLTERIPKSDVIEMLSYAEARGARVIGPNSPGIICPEETRLGYLGGSNPQKAYKKGPVGIISRSGGMCTELANILTRNGIGQSTVIGIGGDPVVGTIYTDLLPLFQQDEETKAIVLFCEPGGKKEEAAAEYIKEKFTKKVIVFFGGRFVDKMPGMRFGHASVIVRPGYGTTEEKIKLFKSAGCIVVENYSEIPQVLKEVL
jgi:succinyl-CoA synthetase alpha subunit